MIKRKDEKWLDEALFSVLASQKPKFDFDKWKQKYPEEFQILESKNSDNVRLHRYADRPVVGRRVIKLAAAAVFVIAVLIGVDLFNSPKAVAFAEIIRAVRQFQTVEYKQIYNPGTDSESVTGIMSIAPDRFRSVLEKGSISIYDSSKAIKLNLFPAGKTALITQRIGDDWDKAEFDYVNWLANLHEDSGRYVGREQMNGKSAAKFVVKKDDFDVTTIWVDPEINLPVRMERIIQPAPQTTDIVLTLRAGDFGREEDGGGFGRNVSISLGITKLHILMTDFKWNIPLDESLFSLEVPQGYTIQEELLNVSKPGQRDLIEALAFFAEMSGGAFPAEIYDLGKSEIIRPMLISKFDRDGNPEEELDKAAGMAGKVLDGLKFAYGRQQEGNWFYMGKDVQFGEADKPICGWKSEGLEQYCVIYGNLNMAEVPADEFYQLVELSSGNN